MDCTACSCTEGFEGTLCDMEIDPCTINASSAECLAQGYYMYVQLDIKKNIAKLKKKNAWGHQDSLVVSCKAKKKQHAHAQLT